MVKGAFSQKVFAEISDGVVTFHQVPNTKLTQFETNALEELNKVTSSKYTANVNLVSNDKSVAGDNWATKTLDICDADYCGTNDDILSAKSVLVHFAVEQIETAKVEQQQGINAADEDRKVDSKTQHYDNAHKVAMIAEQKTTNLRRTTEDLPSGGMKSGTNGHLVITDKNAKLSKYDGQIIIKGTHVTEYNKSNNKPKQTFIPDK